MSNKLNISFTRLLQTVSAAALVSAMIAPVSISALAQSNQISVDLSVLNDGGYGPATIPGYAGGASKLLMPGPVSPQSSYFGPEVSVINPIVAQPTPPAESTQTMAQDVLSSSLSVSDSAPPPEPEPAEAPPEPVVQETTTTMTAETIPEAPTEASADTTSAGSSEAVSLEPAEPDSPPPPPAPETMETETTATEVVETETETSADTDETEMAAASTMASAAAPGRALQVVFAADDSKLPVEAENDLLEVTDKIRNSDGLRIQLLAFAGGEGLSASKARRLSLSRALSVRSFFIENGIRSTRIDVRALGDKTDEQPVNRVDVNIVER